MNGEVLRRMPGHMPGMGAARSIGTLWPTHMDLPLLLLLLATAAYGLPILYSAAGRETGPVLAQCARISVGLVAMFIAAQISPRTYFRLAPWAFAACLLLVAATHVVGMEVKGSARWLRVPGLVSFQPSELMKLALPLALAAYLGERRLPPRFKHTFWSIVIIAAPVMLIAMQPDLGTSVIIGASGVLVLLLAGIRWRLVFSVLGLFLAATPALWFALQDYQRQRILTLLNPESDPLGAGWNTMQAKTAIGSGGLSGKGLFEGTQSHLDFLPESRTDFVVAVLAEELGFIGVIVLLVLYMLVIARGLYISVQAQDMFGRLLCGSIVFTFFVYVFVNIAMVSGLLPVVGVPLPLVSYGGTSIVSLLAGFGVLMSVHTHRRKLI